MVDAAAAVGGVRGVDDVRLRWEGHRLRGELTIAVDPTLAVAAGHAIAHEVEHELLHGIMHLDAMSVHVEPVGGPRSQAHAITAHHYNK